MEAGAFWVWGELAADRAAAGDPEGAESTARWAPGGETPWALGRLALMREAAGDHDGAERLAREALNRGDGFALTRLTVTREAAGDHTKAESLARLAADTGRPFPLLRLAHVRNGLDGDRAPLQRRFSSRIPGVGADSLIRLGLMSGLSGYRAAIEHLARQAADAGHPDASALVKLWNAPDGDELLWPHGLDPDGTPSKPWTPDVPSSDFAITDLDQ